MQNTTIVVRIAGNMRLPGNTFVLSAICGRGSAVSLSPADRRGRHLITGVFMDTEQAVAETAPHQANEDGVESRRDGSNKITLGPGDSLDGKLYYNGHLTV